MPSNTPADAAPPRLAGDVGERGLIDHIRRRLPPPPADLIVGPGDDGAVVRPDRGALQILTTDSLVEGVHFDLRYSSPADVGHKALAVNLSDVAAMGAVPRFALLSLMLPAGCPMETIDGLLDGVIALAVRTKVAIAGGNITRSPGPLVVDVALTGAAKPRKLLTRSGGRPGDRLYVSGTIGAARAGLGRLQSDGFDSAPEGLDECVERHRRPEPRVRLGALLGRMRAASACMDLSDGLADAVRQVAEASGTGATIEADRLPVHPAAAAWFRSRGFDPIDAALEGGDDYELLIAVPPRFRGRFRAVARLAQGLTLTSIGELTGDKALTVVRDGTGRDLPQGFVHF